MLIPGVLFLPSVHSESRFSSVEIAYIGSNVPENFEKKDGKPYLARVILLNRKFVVEQGSPSMVKGVGFRSLSCRGSWVQIPPPAPTEV